VGADGGGCWCSVAVHPALWPARRGAALPTGCWKGLAPEEAGGWWGRLALRAGVEDGTAVCPSD